MTFATTSPSDVTPASGLPASSGHSLAYDDFDADALLDVAAGVPAADVSVLRMRLRLLRFTGTAAKSTSTEARQVSRTTAGRVTGSVLRWRALKSTRTATTICNRNPYEGLGGKARVGAVVVLYGLESGLSAANAQSFIKGCLDVPGSHETNDRSVGL